MGKKDNRRTRKMNQKRAQKKKLARDNSWMKAAKVATPSAPKTAKVKAAPKKS